MAQIDFVQLAYQRRPGRLAMMPGFSRQTLSKEWRRLEDGGVRERSHGRIDVALDGLRRITGEL